jgi:hypothetical protein
VKNTVNESAPARRLKALCFVSAAYDFALGLPLLVAAGPVARMMGSPTPEPLVNAQLNGLFTFTLALGYLWAARDVLARRGYLWIAGVVCKAGGALLFLADHLAGRSPDSFLAFVATDGTLALATLILLLQARPPRAG